MEHLEHGYNWRYYATIVVFLLAYAFIITEKMNRALIALLGAGIIVGIGAVDLRSALTTHIEWETIMLLIGMMIIVYITSKSGLFEYIAIKTAQFSKGKPIQILISLSLLTAICSAFLDNVTTILLIVPITLSITRILKVDPRPFLILEVIYSNIGGTATLIGDPPNIMIGSANKHLTFNSFLMNLAPIIAIIVIATTIIIYFIYRKRLVTTSEQIKILMSINEKDYIKDKTLLIKSLVVLGITLLGFILHSILHLDAALVAMLGATILMIIGVKERDLEEIFANIEWVTIFFFAGLFVLVGGLVDIGLIGTLAKKVLELTNGNIQIAAPLILWVSGIASAIIDNIPFVATMIPLIQDLSVGMGLSPDAPQVEVLWWSLALGACLGGNGTLIGASANVVAAGIASREGHKFGYWDFLKIGLPITLFSLLLSNVYLYVKFLI
ncbi:ArsB/NhaD family transporter [Bacillus sp. AFS041924]|uniref:ArsB/NhaD family transporter n=1 Tax=Bacillus sp. AFS041924 TaxID=2033503 RepID=UPI000BFDEB79|nr:ArsB/NhaD family transporter [Bacillus sp. AFS041924]PGS55950.1 hypothetical protein COC46_03065 [Bacillus sp. AFS041924]